MQRKLAAILSADVVGYSGLMQADEAGTLERLKANRRRFFDPQVSAYEGRLFKLMGDGALVEFPSVIAAVECALAIQEATERAAAGEAEGRRIRYRIGINLGEVIVEGDDIYGEGVNVVARLQTLAPIGGVALSKMVRDSIEGKTACRFEDMGEHQVKEHDRPVHAFSVSVATVQPQPMPRDVQPSPPHQADKVSICVLPFINMSGDVEQEYFSDGITEDIITDLSKVSSLFVTARNTAFTFKGKSVDVSQIARQLRVTHVLEGSVRKSGGRVRITAQLIDGATGGHVWAERYDRDLDDIFALQDEISEAIVNALKVRLLPEEKKAIERRGTDNVEAYEVYLMARQEYMTGAYGNRQRYDAVIRFCRRATEIDPDYASAWALMALSQTLLHIVFGVGADEALASAERALALNPDLAEAHAVKARLLLEMDRTDEANTEIEIALRRNTESWEVNSNAALTRYRQGRFEEAVPLFEKAAALEEADFGSPAMLISCYRTTGDSDGMRRVAEMTQSRCEKVLAGDRNNGTAMAYLSDALAIMGQGERAREWMRRALLIDPDNIAMHYNFACSLAGHLRDTDGALEMLAPVFTKAAVGLLNHAKIDPDLDSIRDDPRFKVMVAEAEARLKVVKQ